MKSSCTGVFDEIVSCDDRRDDLKDELKSLKGRVVMAERSAASNEAQKKALLQDKVDLQREVS